MQGEERSAMSKTIRCNRKEKKEESRVSSLENFVSERKNFCLILSLVLNQ